MRLRTFAGSLLGGLVAAALLALVVLSSAGADEPDSAFARNGPGHTFVTEARATGYEVHRLVAGPRAMVLDAGLEPERTLLAILAPGTPPEAADVREVEALLQAGGRVLVADNFGQSNVLLARFGLVLERVRLVDEDGSPWYNGTLDGDSFQLAKENATAIRVAESPRAQVLATSGPQSYLDRGGDAVVDRQDPRGPFPVAAEVQVGESGRLVVLANPHPMVGDAMGEDRELRRLVLAHLLPQGGLVLVDDRDNVADPVLAAARIVTDAATQPWAPPVLITAAAVVLAAALLPPARDAWIPHVFRPMAFRRRAQVDPPHPITTGTTTVAAWTPRGTAAFALGAAALLLGLALANAQALLVGGWFLVALAGAVLVPSFAARATRTIRPERATEGGLLDVEVLLAPVGPFGGAAELHDGLPNSFDLRQGTNLRAVRLRRGRPARWTYQLQPAAVGPYPQGPLKARTTDPLGLRAHERHLQLAQPLPVAPRPGDTRKTPYRTRVPRLTMGPHLVNRAGDGFEFHALRDYQVGDSIRSVNWKASARSQDLVVNQRVLESMLDITFVLDARRIAGAGPESQTPLAQGARVVMGLARAAVQARDRVRLVAYGEGVRTADPPAGPGQARAIQEFLAALGPAGDTPLQAAVDETLPTLRRGRVVAVVSAGEADGTFAQAVGALAAREAYVVVLFCRPETAPSTPDEGDPEPDADRIQRDRDELGAALRARGVAVYDLAPGVPIDDVLRIGGMA